MENNDQKLVQEHRKHRFEIREIEKKLENLRKTKGQISEDRYTTLEKNYEKTLHGIRPEMETIEKRIESRIDELTINLEDNS